MNLFVCVLPAKVLVDGTHKVRIAISHNSETRYIATRFKVPSPKNIKNGRVTGKEIGNAEYINQQLNQRIQQMYKIYDTIPNAECYTCSQLLNIIESKANKYIPVTFKEIAFEWLDIRKKKISTDSVKIFTRAINTFLDFAGENYMLSMLNEKTVFDYDDFLCNRNVLSRSKHKLPKTLKNATINLRMRTFRAIVRYAETRKYVFFDIDPFLNYEEKPETVRDAFLSVDELRKIRDIKTDDYNLELCRDLFMLSFYLAGMNLKDMLEINFRGESISFIRGKTQSTRKDGLKTSFTIQPEARALLDKYTDKNGFVHVKNKTNKSTIANFFERHLPKLEPLIESRVHIIYYSARKTFSQLAYMLGVQEKVIKYCIGDALSTKEKDMLLYYTQTNQQMADNAIRCVLDFVASNKSEDDIFKTLS